MSTEDDINMPSALLNYVSVLLSKAAPNSDLHIRSSILERLEMPKGSVEAVIGVLANAAGIENNYIREL
ncbi:unannotated protein [freshwater metagenome]|uniref:Unannotated protein n=1 Tax=freshwater metagenome TaxID=449393 RepID=A0A6J6XE31_9ZZZZ